MKQQRILLSLQETIDDLQSKNCQRKFWQNLCVKVDIPVDQITNLLESIEEDMIERLKIECE